MYHPSFKCPALLCTPTPLADVLLAKVCSANKIALKSCRLTRGNFILQLQLAHALPRLEQLEVNEVIRLCGTLGALRVERVGLI